jgi:cell division protease FtsH
MTTGRRASTLPPHQRATLLVLVVAVLTTGGGVAQASPFGASRQPGATPTGAATTAITPSGAPTPAVSSAGQAAARAGYGRRGGVSGAFFAALSVTAMIAALAAAGLYLRRRRGAARRRAMLAADAEAKPPATRFRDVAGCDEVVDELREIVEFLAEPQRFAAVGARMPRGVILHGPPGTGKTLLARAVAGEAGVAFHAVSGSDFVEKYVGVGAARVRDLFTRAGTGECGAVVFIDEIDAVGRSRHGSGGGSEERENTLNQLLVAMDGFDQSARVVVIAATNRLDLLDDALLRPGRFDRHLRVDPPNERGRLAILAVHAAGKPIVDHTALERLARVTAGASGATLALMLNEAAIMAARDRRSVITTADIDEGQLRAIAGPLKADAPFTEQERRRIAYHEAGHALAAELCPTHPPTQRVTILARGQAGGLALYGRTDAALVSPQDLHERCVVALAGRAAEELVFGEISSGAANDLEIANAAFRQAVSELGFSRRVGQLVVPARVTGAAGVAETTRELVDAEVRGLLDDAYQDACGLLGQCRDALDRLAGALLTREQLDRAGIERAVGTIPAAAKPRRVSSRLASLRVVPAADETHHAARRMPEIAAIAPEPATPPAKTA